MSSSQTKPDIKNALKTKDPNKRLTLSELSDMPSFINKSRINKDNTKNVKVSASISNSVRELKEMTSKLKVPLDPTARCTSRPGTKKKSPSSVQRIASQINNLKFSTPSVNNTPCHSRLASPIPSFKTEPQERSVHDIEDNTIELITQNYKKCLEIQKKKILDANEKINDLSEVISQKDAEIIQNKSKIDELEKSEKIGSYLLNYNVTEHLHVKQRVDIIEGGMERFQYVILKTKRLLEEAQKHKESSSKETTELSEIILNNRAETKVFKEKCKCMVQTLRNMQNDCLLEMESLTEIRAEVKFELASLKTWWQEYQTKIVEMISQNKSCQDMISEVKEILTDFSGCIVKLDKSLSSTPSAAQIANENCASITSIDEKLKDLVSCFEALRINTIPSTVSEEVLSQNNTEVKKKVVMQEVDASYNEENKKMIDSQGLNLEVDQRLKSEKEALLSYICFLHTQANSPVQAKRYDSVPMGDPLTTTSQGSEIVSKEFTQPTSANISLSKKKGRKLKQDKEQNNYQDIPNYSSSSRYPTRRKTRARIQSLEGNNNDDKVTGAEQPKKKRKIRKLGGDVYNYELDDSDEADIPKKIGKAMDAALPETTPQISITKN
ncbi:hypothetical protein INT48_005090 [Thamnidium elegans]|uniref:Uncharacterized protein n=1 Tax=Thamnidium elegans TaxID=101142 RepID=A0A8H7SKJ6_9FUNG|nr:hypothetical protein INT48_005090 [Thamnidium elegans]